MAHDSQTLISDDGSISVTIPCSEVTWFKFLKNSRVHNSENGGWNVKSFWRSHGLHKLVANGKAKTFIENWTKASLEKQAKPDPRLSDFKIANRQSVIHEGKRGKDDTPALDESKLNWNLALFLHNKLKDQVVTYELPLSSEKSGQLKADVAVFHQDGLMEIVELKGNNGSDSPLMALVEAICYALQSLRCREAIINEVESILNRECNPIHSIHLIIAGPPTYWKRCSEENNPMTDEDATSMRKIVDKIESAVNSVNGFENIQIRLTLADLAIAEPGKPKESARYGKNHRPPEKSAIVELL